MLRCRRMETEDVDMREDVDEEQVGLLSSFLSISR